MDLDEDNAFQFNELPRSNHARRLDDQTMDEPDRKRANHNAESIDLSRLYSWPSSRIVRVPRASGGKDRHSKVVTSKGQLRDRRVRLSVNTAIQFYDLQDRLGYDQPSKAVEWLLKAAEGSISELPPVLANNGFPDTPKCYEKRPGSTAGNNNIGGSDQLTVEDLDPRPVGGCEVRGCNNNYLPHEQNGQQRAAGNKSCSSASTETTSKGSGISLSRSEIRVKARERAKERVAEKEKETTSRQLIGSQAMSGSFTELLSSGMNNKNNNDGSPNSESNFSLKSPGNNWSSSSAATTTPMDYFTNVLQMQLASSNNPTMASPPMYSVVEGDSHNGELLQHLSFVPDQIMVSNNSHDQRQNGNLNFTISSLSSNSMTRSSLAGFNGGTLQSNSSSSSPSSMLWPSLQLPQRFPIADGSPQSFVIAAPMDNNSNNVNHNQFLSGYDAAARLHFMHSKGKGKN